MGKAAFINHHGALYPMQEEAEDMLRALPEGREVIVTVHAARNPRHHRLLFALLNEVMGNGAWRGDVDGLLDWCKIGTGHVRTIIGPDGETHFIPKSISFASMPQDKFNKWFDSTINLVCERLLVGCSQDALKDKIFDSVDRGLSSQRRDYA